MQEPPLNESTHERLNRELSRLRVRSFGFWGGWAVLIGIVGLYAALTLNTVQNVRFVTGVAGQTMPLASETGMHLKMRVEVESRTRDITLPSQLVHPTPGDLVCLRAGEHRFTGHTSYVIVSNTLCDGPSATDQVD
ncbi:MAG: hypothetical protein AAGL89_01540 [Pseudomonadota bacterium]